MGQQAMQTVLLADFVKIAKCHRFQLSEGYEIKLIFKV